MLVRPHVFLDMDGVVNKVENWQRQYETDIHDLRDDTDPSSPRVRLLPIDPECLNRIVAFIEDVDAIVVISSSWRKVYQRDWWERNLPQFASRFPVGDAWRTGSDRRGHRGNEVIGWLNENGWPPHVIFDDDSDFYQFQPFVHTNMLTGCSDIHIQQARSVLRAQLENPILPVPGLSYKQADLLESRCEYIAHGCNAQGVMGSGIAKAIRDKWPECYTAYRNHYEQNGGLKLAEVVWYHNEGRLIGEHPYVYDRERYIANCITQEFYGKTGGHYVDYDAVITSLETVGIRAKEDNCFEVGIPLIGMGLGGGAPSILLPRIRELGQRIGVRFTICIPDTETYKKMSKY